MGRCIVLPAAIFHKDHKAVLLELSVCVWGGGRFVHLVQVSVSAALSTGCGLIGTPNQLSGGVNYLWELLRCNCLMLS